MRHVISIMLLIAMATAAHARLGETQEECKKRYGKPNAEGKVGRFPYMGFEKAGFIVSTLFYRDPKGVYRCGRISYAKVNKLHPVYKRKVRKTENGFLDITRVDCGRTQLDAKEIKAFLNANTRNEANQHRPWIWQKPRKNFSEWERLLDRNRYETLTWLRKDDPHTKAIYYNRYPDNMLVIRNRYFKNFSWDQQGVKDKDAGKGKLKGF